MVLFLFLCLYASLSFTPQIANYNYIYSINLWLLLNPWWLCFDWSMGCVPLIKTPTDVRILAVLAMWLLLLLLISYCLLGQSDQFRR